MSRLQRNIKRLKIQQPHKNKYEGMGNNKEDKETKYKSKKLPYSPLKPVGPGLRRKIKDAKEALCFGRARYNYETAVKQAVKRKITTIKVCPFCNQWHLYGNKK